MFKIAVIVAVLVLLGGILVSHMGSQKPLRGLVRLPGRAQQTLLSRARPAVGFELASGMRLLSAGWCSVSPETQTSGASPTAKLWAAVYGDSGSLLVTAVADAENAWEWLPGDHEPYTPIRAMKRDMGDRHVLHESLTTYDGKSDPFGCRGACLVYRGRLVLDIFRCEVIVEYHENLPEALAGNIEFENDYLNAFQARAREAGRIVRLDREEADRLAESIEKLGTLPRDYSRRSLARWTGQLWHHGGER